MVHVVLLLAAAVVVKNDGVQLQSRCAAYDGAVATLPANAPVEILFAVNGSGTTTCYKVALNLGGRRLSGYLEPADLLGLDSFVKEVQQAPVVLESATQAGRHTAQGTAVAGATPLHRASQLLGQNQSLAALDVLEKTLKSQGRDYQTLVAAGLAAYRSDQPRLALEYLAEAESLRSDLSVQQLVRRIRKEVAGDQSNEKLYGTRFLLRYEGSKLTPEAARNMVALLEQEYSRISAELGCRSEERIVTVVQSQEAYRASTETSEWSAGLFDGSRIRVPVLESSSVSPRTRQVLEHELVHACLANIAQWPTWFHEGMAQKLSGVILSPARLQQIRHAVRSGKIPRLENMTQTWFRLSPEHANMAYDYALAAVGVLYEAYGNFGIQNVLRYPERFAQIAADVDRRLNGESPPH